MPPVQILHDPPWSQSRSLPHVAPHALPFEHTPPVPPAERQ